MDTDTDKTPVWGYKLNDTGQVESKLFEGGKLGKGWKDCPTKCGKVKAEICHEKGETTFTVETFTVEADTAPTKKPAPAAKDNTGNTSSDDGDDPTDGAEDGSDDGDTDPKT